MLLMALPAWPVASIRTPNLRDKKIGMRKVYVALRSGAIFPMFTTRNRRMVENYGLVTSDNIYTFQTEEASFVDGF